MVTILDDNREEQDYKELLKSAYVDKLRQTTMLRPLPTRPKYSIAKPPPPRSRLFSTKNIDLLALRPENQTRTTVTPLVFRLAKGLFPEQLKLLDSSFPKSQDDERLRRRKLMDLLHKSKKSKGEAFFAKEHRLQGPYWSCMIRDGVEYKVNIYHAPLDDYPHQYY